LNAIATTRRTALGSPVLLLLGVIGVLAAAPLAVAAAPSPAPSPIYANLHLDRTPISYVVLLDTSPAMQPQSTWVQGELTALLAALPSNPDVTVIGFDRRIEQDLRVRAAGDLNSLGAPAGQGSDLGRALETAVGGLENGPPRAAAIIPLVASAPSPEPSSPYAVGTGTAWSDLGKRAADLFSRVDAYVFPFLFMSDPARQSTTALLNQVFPGRVDEGPGLLAAGPDLVQVKDEMLKRLALEALAPDRTASVTAQWPKAPPALDPGRSSATVDLSLHSSASRVPLRVSKLRFTVTGSKVAAHASAATPVDLRPGATVQVPVTLSWDAQDGGFGTRTVDLSYHIDVTGDVTTPWQQDLAGIGFGPFKPTFQGAQETLAGSGTVWPSEGADVLYGTAGMVIFLVLLFGGAALIDRLTRPRMAGSLSALYNRPHDDDPATVEEVTLGPVRIGGLAELKTTNLAPPHLGGAVDVRPGTGSTGLVITYTPKDDTSRKDSADCPPGGTVMVNGVLFVHHENDPNGGPSRRRRS